MRNYSLERKINLFKKRNLQNKKSTVSILHQMQVTLVWCTRSNKCRKNLSGLEKVQSSPCRELKVICFGLYSLYENLQNSYVSWSIDNYAASIIVWRGSIKNNLQDLALKIYSLCIWRNIVLNVSWVSREFNLEVDELPKHIEVIDWEISSAYFNYLNSIWRPFTIHCYCKCRK